MSTVSTDPIADMLTRIRNANAVRRHQISLPHSKLKESVARLLAKNGFVLEVAVADAAVGKQLIIDVSNPQSNSKITEVKRLSTPGRRMYVNSGEIPQVKNGRGIVIISTSKGVMTGKEAKAQGVGGELLCSVY